MVRTSFVSIPDKYAGEPPGRLDQFVEIIPTNSSGPNQRPDLGVGQLCTILESLIQRLDIGVVLDRDGYVRVGRPTN